MNTKFFYKKLKLFFYKKKLFQSHSSKQKTLLKIKA